MKCKSKKEENNHIVYHKKSIDNGDLSRYIPKQLVMSTNWKGNNSEGNQNFSMNAGSKTVHKRVTPLTISQKQEKEGKEFINNIKKVKNSQDALDTKLKTVPFNNKNENFSIKSRLPKTINEIEENEELVKMLLKNPNDMTAEEKIYISSFNKEEFKRFIQFLKMKNRELSWRGNDWGSGHYLDHYIDIYRKTGHSENERFLSLKKFLKLNYTNFNAEKGKNISFMNSKPNFVMDSFIEQADQAGAPMQPDSEKEEMKNKAFEVTSKIILKELESFKNVLLSHKNELYVNKIETQNNLIFKDLEQKTKLMKDDVEKIAKIKDKNDNSEIEKLYEDFKCKQTSNSNENIEEYSAIQKIQNYCQRMNLITMELINKLNKDITNGEVDLQEAKNTIIRLKILDEIEADDFIKPLKIYHGEKIKIALLKCIIDSEVYDEIERIAEENDCDIEDVKEYYSNDEYDYFDMEEDKGIFNNYEKKKKLLVGKQLEEYEIIMKKKSSLHIQKVYRGHLLRRRFFTLNVFINLMAKRLTKKIREYTKKLKEIKNDSAYKITYLLRKNFFMKNAAYKISRVTGNWLINGGKIINIPFSNKNKISCALKIQKTWRRYKDRIMVIYYYVIF